MNWTKEEIELATKFHEEYCGCSRSVLEPAEGFGIQGWLSWARDVIATHPQDETLF